MEKDEVINGFMLEMRRGTIILCVLAKLSKPAYGYNLIAELADTGIPIETNTLYPLLRRLESQGLLESSWDTETAKPRKYYATTGFGNEVLNGLIDNWRKMTQNMNKILKGCSNE